MIAALRPWPVVLRHAIQTALVATVGDREAEVIDGAAKGVHDSGWRGRNGTLVATADAHENARFACRRKNKTKSRWNFLDLPPRIRKIPRVTRSNSLRGPFWGG